jgi:hypothetical protein
LAGGRMSGSTVAGAMPEIEITLALGGVNT